MKYVSLNARSARAFLRRPGLRAEYPDPVVNKPGHAQNYPQTNGIMTQYFMIVARLDGGWRECVFHSPFLSQVPVITYPSNPGVGSASGLLWSLGAMEVFCVCVHSLPLHWSWILIVSPSAFFFPGFPEPRRHP